ncbi:MAG: MATE family efflux transporter [Oscillospiraceae bacterium]|nr:MATE family efflux transporter [Oscillospiraceae bacterium]MBQ2607319.1 MATE family efflux transporter [Oscillospiraceae bacterium]
MPSTMIRDMTRGPVVSQLLRFAFPLFVSNALQAVYNLVDMVIVGNYIGKAGMSAVSIGGDILHLLTFVAMGFSSAGQVLIARSVGMGRYEEIKKTIGTMFSFLLGVSLAISAACYLLRFSVLRWLNTPAAAEAFAMDYMVTCVCGLPFIYGYNIVSAILRGMGDSRRPFLFIAAAAILNTVLDILFVKYLGMEVFGAALATVIGQGVSFLSALVYLYRRRESFGFDFRPESFRIDPPAFRRLLSLGIPMAIQSAAVSFSKIVLMAWVNLFDVTYSALAGIFNKVNTVCGVISQAFTTAGSTMAGQNLSAGKHDRVNRILLTILSIGLGLAALATAVMLLHEETLYAVFTTDADVLRAAGVLTLPIILNFYGSATRSAAFSLINGSGRSRLNLAIAIIDGVVSRMGLAALLGFAFRLDCFGFWMGDSLAGFMPLIIGSIFYLSGKWKESGETAR